MSNSFRILFCFFILTCSGCSTIPPHYLDLLDGTIEQAIVVYPLNEHSTQARLSAWQKQDKRWKLICKTSAVIGRSGLASLGEKREGDGKTPSGIFVLGPAFGYAPSIDTGLIYRQATDHDFWVDDVHSLQYNQWVSGKPQADSFEHMRRSDNLYRYGVVIDYNTNPIVPGKGSAIFMHIWRSRKNPTAGCVALNQHSLCQILRWLQSKDKPVIILENQEHA